MPTIDSDLFQLITLALLAITLLVLLLVLSAVGRVRKAVESLRSAGPPATGDQADERGQETPTPARERDEAPRGAAEPEERDEAVAAYASPGAAEEPARAQEPAEAREPAEAGSASAAPHDEPAGATAQPAPEEEPQEQPFERDGRWWFKRGDELLVYDEGTGQWVPAPTTGGSVAASSSERGTQTAELGGAAGQQTGGEAGGLWKCPSCGATNGSTATTCRMCFAARP